MEKVMRPPKLPKTDSIQKLAEFWDTHDLTEFEGDLEELTQPLFVRGNRTSVSIDLLPQEIRRVKKIAKSKGVNETSVLREWILERLHGSS